jgi:hypothetical protein
MIFIRWFRDRGRKIGICGQAPSDYPAFARMLVAEGHAPAAADARAAAAG